MRQWLFAILVAGAIVSQIACSQQADSNSAPSVTKIEPADTASPAEEINRGAKVSINESVDSCVSRLASETREWRNKNGLDPVVRADMLEEFSQECTRTENQTPLPAPSRVAETVEPLTPASISSLKKLSLGVSAEILPNTPGCNGVRKVVSNLLQVVEQRQAFHERQIKGGVPTSDAEYVTQVEILDQTADAGDFAASALSCKEWAEARRKVVWWFRGATGR